MSKAQKIAIIVLGIILILGFAKNLLIKSMVTVAASQVTGVPISIDSISVGVLRHSIQIKGFKFYNPPGFPKEVLIDIKELRVDYNLNEILKGKLHFPMLVVDLNKMVVIKNKEGQLNVDSLKFAKKKTTQEESKEKESKPLDLRIDEAHLNLGKVVVKDFTQGEPPLVLAYDTGIKNKVYKNINSAEKFAALLVLEGLGPTALREAAIYGAATIIGAGFIPAGVAGVLLGKAFALENYHTSMDRIYKTVKAIIGKRGTITQEKKSASQIFLKTSYTGHDVVIEINQKPDRIVEVKVTARKLMLPKPEVANGIIYQLSEELR